MFRRLLVGVAMFSTLGLMQITTLMAQSNPGNADGHMVVLTPASPSAERSVTIVAPGNRQHGYNLVYLDTRAFAAGGTLHIDIDVSQNSGTDASFDLYPANEPNLNPGSPGNTLLGRYDIRRGASTRMDYRFEPGQLLALGCEGNWFSPKGAKGLVRVRASVEAFQAPPTGGEDHRVVLTPAAPVAERTTKIVAPGNGRHGYNVFYIDTRQFPQGGVLVLDMTVATNSATDASFDLFPGNMTPQQFLQPGRASLGGKYDVRRGTAARIEYRFAPGQIFAFGLEGNWFSPQGAAGGVRFRATVHP